MSNLEVFFLLLYTSGVTVISYKGYAIRKGWPIGKLFLADNSILKMLALVSILGSIVTSFFFIKWYWVLGGLLLGWLLSGIITSISAKHTQSFSIFLFLISWIFLVVKF